MMMKSCLGVIRFEIGALFEKKNEIKKKIKIKIQPCAQPNDLLITGQVF